MLSFFGLLSIIPFANAESLIANHDRKNITDKQNNEIDLLLEYELEQLDRSQLIQIIKESAIKAKKTNLILNNNHGIDIQDLRVNLGAHEHVR